MDSLQNKYFAKRKADADWEDITVKFAGVKILSVSGLDGIGEAVNVYSEQWVGSQKEDFLVTQKDDDNNDVIIRKNIDVQLTFVCGERYGAKDTQSAHDAFIDYICNHGDLYIKSEYKNKYAHVVCLKGYKPTDEKLHRGKNSYIMGTIELHLLDKVADNINEKEN